VYFGTVAQDLAALGAGEFDGGWFGLALLVGGLAATLLMVILVTRRATRTLGAHLQRQAAGSGHE